MTTVEAKTVPMAEDFTFTYTDDIDTPTKVIRLMRMQLDSTDLALIEEIKMTFPDGSTVVNSGPLHWNNRPLDDMEKLIATLNEIGIPYEVDYAGEMVNVEDGHRGISFAFNDGKYTFLI